MKLDIITLIVDIISIIIELIKLIKDRKRKSDRSRSIDGHF